jgi:hypothetical protein
VLTGFVCRRISVDKAGPELLDPTQDRASAHVDTAAGQDVGNAFGRGGQLQVVADGHQDDVPKEAMASHEARRLVGRVATTGTAGAHGTAALVVAIVGQV